MKEDVREGGGVGGRLKFKTFEEAANDYYSNWGVRQPRVCNWAASALGRGCAESCLLMMSSSINRTQDDIYMMSQLQYSAASSCAVFFLCFFSYKPSHDVLLCGGTSRPQLGFDHPAFLVQSSEWRHTQVASVWFCRCRRSEVTVKHPYSRQTALNLSEFVWE